MVMGRGSDTRMYAPRSESSHMYSSANEDEGKYSPTSPEDNEKRAEEKKLKEEAAKKKAKDIKHIKIKPSQGLGQGPGLETEPGLDDGNKRDDEREIGLQGGPAGSRGHLLDLATGAKTGTGSAMGTGNSAVRTGEPMEDAWSELLKEKPCDTHDVGDGTDEDTKRYFDEEVRPEVMNPNTPRPHALMNNKRLKEKINDMVMGGEPLDADLTDEYNYRIVENDLNAQGNPVSNTRF